MLLNAILAQRGFIEGHSGALTILVLCALVLGTVLVLTPQLLRAQQRKLEMVHAERMKAMEEGLPTAPMDDRSTATGRMAVLVPIVVMCAAATVTCFLVAYGSEYLFAVSLGVWCVAGVVSLAAITGGVALMGRLAQLHVGEEEDELAEHPVEKG